MKKILTSIISLILIGSVLFNFSEVSAQEQNTFQQVMNYIITADPYKSDQSFTDLINTKYNIVAKIFDRENCIAGTEMKVSNSGIEEENYIQIVKIYWNNVDKNSIEISESGQFLTLRFSGDKLVVQITYFDENGNQIPEWTESYTTFSFDPGTGLRRDRLENAIRLLFTEHCSGMQSAF